MIPMRSSLGGGPGFGGLPRGPGSVGPVAAGQFNGGAPAPGLPANPGGPQLPPSPLTDSGLPGPRRPFGQIGNPRLVNPTFTPTL